MRVIHKQVVKIASINYIPMGAEIIEFTEDPNGIPCIWFIRDSDVIELSPIQYVIYGTGHVIDAKATYIDSCIANGQYVWHLFKLD